VVGTDSGNGPFRTLSPPHRAGGGVMTTDSTPLHGGSDMPPQLVIGCVAIVQHEIALRSWEPR
jgi:hypothetical protein